MKENLVRFLASTQGRMARILMGAGIISLGMFVVRGIPGSIMTVVGLIPIAGGLFDFCLLAAALGYPLSGSKIRRQFAGK